jgi:mono/diheme cytochrome c family protein
MGLLAAATTAWAYGGDVTTFKATYNLNAGSKILKANCSICHLPNNVRKENVYGAPMVAPMRALGKRKVTPEILRALDNLDSDGDGATNIEEITADTLPWDATSVPSKPLKVAKLADAPTLDDIGAALAVAEPGVRKAGGIAVAEVRLASGGASLALSVNVTDKAFTATTADWTGVSVEVGAAAVEGQEFRRLIIAPKTAAIGDVRLLVGALVQETPAVLWKATARDGGYDLVALVPMAALGIDPAGAARPLDVAVTTQDGRYTQLFDRPKGYFDHADWVVTSVTGPAHQVVEDGGDRWSTNRAMKAGDWLQVDMRKPYKLAKVVVDTSASPNDAAQGLQVLTSLDGKAFVEAALLTADECRQAKGLLAVTLPNVEARYLKIVQLGATATSWWSIYSLRVDIVPPAR